ncbi:ATP-dependent DNA helicase DinG [Spongorhabdus nitratireducens]
MLTDQLKKTIQQAYRTFLENKSLRARNGQKVMIAEVARNLAAIKTDDEGVRTGDPAVVVIEAGTGTGKTVGYALPALAVAQHQKKKLIISTATVALQEQLIYKDLPDIRQSTGMDFRALLAKGRGRYICLSKLDQLLESQQSNQAMADLFAEEGFRIDTEDSPSLELFQKMLEQLATSKWDGERDSWPESIDDLDWQTVTTDHSQCTGRRCSHYSQCAFFKAREGLTKADIVVTNHDLVLADLSLGGGAILPSPKDSIYVFDEGHHLPDKAIGHFASHTRINATMSWLETASRHVKQMLTRHALPGVIGERLEQLEPAFGDLKEQLGLMKSLLLSVAEFGDATETERSTVVQYRFPGGKVPEEVRAQAEVLKAGFSKALDLASKASDNFKDAMDGELDGIDSWEAEALFPAVGAIARRLDNCHELWMAYSIVENEESGEPPVARWLKHMTFGGSEDLEVASSPILAAKTLRQVLWNHCHGAIVTSATLTALGKFDRYRMRAGIPKDSRCEVVPSPFQHDQAAVLNIPAMEHEPTSDGHSEEVAEQLTRLLDNTPGSLVLFSSRRQLKDVYALLPEKWQDRILLQDDYSKQELLRRHRRHIDDGQQSILFGLASLAEGVDLPGQYCEHVVIVRLPFSVPDDPVEAALSEWIEEQGRNPFMEISVPDAAMRLVQACGRLLRSETDSGYITLLDRRVVTRRYGRLILDSLPPYRRYIA